MRNYMVRIEGRGVDLVVKNRWASMFGVFGLGRTAHCTGFFATRYVSSDSEAKATQLALQQITDELVRTKVIAAARLPQLVLHVDEVAIVAQAHPMKPDEGFTFFET